MGLSLRRILGVFIALLGTAAVVACLSLVVLTTLIHESSKSPESALQGLRLAEKTQIELLLVARTPETAEREAIIEELRQSLNALGGYSTGTQEAEALPRAVSSVEGYLGMLPGAERGSPGRLRSLEAARAALGDLVGINVQQARAAQDQAGHWDRLADGIGLGAVAFVLAAAAFLIWYVGTQALRPILALAEVIERFGRGQLPAPHGMAALRSAPAGPRPDEPAEQRRQVFTGRGARPSQPGWRPGRASLFPFPTKAWE